MVLNNYISSSPFTQDFNELELEQIILKMQELILSQRSLEMTKCLVYFVCLLD